MPDPSVHVAILTGALLAKHFLFDFVVQTRLQMTHKGSYGHPAGLSHAALHAVGSGAVLGLAGVPAGLLAGVAAAELLVHYHLDWAKARLVARTGWDYADSRFWALFGADQLLHGLFYVVVAWLAARP